jgi:hypothetical protein
MSYIPKPDAEFDAFFSNLLNYATPKIASTPVVWTHVPLEELTTLTKLYGDWDEAYSKTKGPHTPVDTEKKNEARTAGEKGLRYFIQRYLIWEPVTNADRVAMGLPLGDLINTPGGEIKDTVAMSFRNDPRPDTHTQYTDYKKTGAANKAKEPYHMAVFQRYIQGPGDPAPSVDKDELWSRDIINMSSPLETKFDSAGAGKICWYRARWEGKDSQQGRWTMAFAMIP